MASDKLFAEWFWTDRWVGSSAFLLPIDARGLYREMLTQAWRRGGSLPNNHEAIRRAVGVTKREWNRCWPLIERFWREEGSSLVNDTQLEVYADAKARQETHHARAKKGAEARWGKEKPQAMLKHCQQDKQALPEQSPLSPVTSHQSPGRQVDTPPVPEARRNHRDELPPDEAWIRFKAAYPPSRRYADVVTEQAFMVECERVGFAVILAGLEKHKRAWTNPRYIPSIQTFIKDKRWEADPVVDAEQKPQAAAVGRREVKSSMGIEKL